MSDPRIPSAERQEMLEQLTNVNLRSVGMLKDALADRCVELLSWALAERDRANTAEAQCAELTIENLQLAVKAGMMADIPETELRARTAGRIAEARADAFAEVVAWLRKQRDDGRTTNGWPIDPYLGMAFEWLADRIEELGKKGAG